MTDEYYHGLKLGEAPAKKRYPLPEEVRQLITILETVRPKNFVTAALSVLGFGTDSQEKLKAGIPQCEDAFARRKGALCVMSTTDEGGSAIILGCVPLNTSLEQQMLQRALGHKQNLDGVRVVLILWQPPLAAGKIKVHCL